MTPEPAGQQAVAGRAQPFAEPDRITVGSAGPAEEVIRQTQIVVADLHAELVRNGLVAWTSGNISARVPGTDLLVIKPSGVSYAQLTPEAMVVCDLNGERVRGRLSPSSDTASHAYIYRHMPEVGGIVHTHSRYATAWAASGEPIPCVITAMADEFGGDIPVGPFAPIGGEEIGHAVVTTLTGHRSPAVLLRSHGVFTIGGSARDAVKAAVMCEDAACTVHLASLRGPLARLAPDQIDTLYRRYQNEYGQRLPDTQAPACLTDTEVVMGERKPRIGILGIMQDLYDDMIPGIAQRQEGYAAELAQALSDVGEFIPGKAVKYREDAERIMSEFEGADLDGVLVIMLTYGPAMRVARLLAESRLPICLANIQPEPAVTPAWDMADMTYNQGVHGAQDTANAMVRAGRQFWVLTDDWRSESFRIEVGRWARAATTVTALRSLKVALVGYAMNDMGDIRVDESALVRSLGPQIRAVAPGEIYRGMQAATDAQIADVIAFENARFDIDPALSREEREDHARMQVALQQMLTDGGYGAYSAHFDAIGEDGRFARLPLAAASTLMAAGYGYGAEGDVLTACLVAAGHTLIGDAHFTEMYAMDFPTDSVLMSHMGEGNWKVARSDRRVKLIKRPLGIGRLSDPPTFLFQYQPGPATIATLVSLEGERFRLVVAEGENLDTPELPALEMPYGQFRPASGVRECLNGWLRAGGPHHEVMNLGHHAATWRVFCELAGIEFVQV